MKTAILGGSFNPPHFGHLYLGFCALKTGYDRVVFLPSGRQLKKQVPGEISDEDRLKMVFLAVSEEKRFCVSDMELRKEGVTYSIDTVRELVANGETAARPGFIIGDDLAQDFASWKDPLELSKATMLILARRNPLYTLEFAFEHIRMENQILVHSSTMIRDLAARHQPFRFLVPDSVYHYIFEKGLYGSDRQDF